MNKKELKDFVNTNGFFFHIQCDQINTDEVKNLLANAKDSKMTLTGKEVPTGESITVFKGVASQNYAKGEKSRNGYKYDQNGWDFESYMHNPIVLWQHDSIYGGIGHAVSFWNDAQGNLNVLFYVDTDTLEERNAVQVKRGYVTAISTGAMTKEYKFEDNATGELLEEADAEEKFGWENIWYAFMGISEFLTLVVTKAEMVENSLVTIGSNEQAIAVQNGIGNHFKAVADSYKANKLKTNAETTDPKEDEETIAEQVEDVVEKVAEIAEDIAETIQDVKEAWEQVAELIADVAEDITQPATKDETVAETPPETVATEGETPEAGDTKTEETAPVPQVKTENEIRLEKELEEVKSEVAEMKNTLSRFQEDVFDAVKILSDKAKTSDNALYAMNKALNNVTTSKGYPHIRRVTNDTLWASQDNLSKVVATLKGV